MLVRAQKAQLTEGAVLVGALNALMTEERATQVDKEHPAVSASCWAGSVPAWRFGELV